MMQLNLFDLKGQPTNLAMRYVQPKYYKVYNAEGCRLVKDPHTAIRMWLIHRDTKLAVVW
jgi:hypothetical protein